MKVLITGAAGFVGGHLINFLKDQQVEITGAGRNEDEVSIVKEFDVSALEMDVCDLGSIERGIGLVRPDFIIHLAAQSSAGLSWKDRLGTLDINIMGTVKLIEGILSSGIKCRLLLVGSAEEYGLVSPEDMPLTESSPLRPVNPYGVSKLISGYLPGLYMKISGDISIVHARSFNHIGPGQSEGFVLSDFAKQISEIEKGLRKPLMSVGNLDAKRDFLDVRDVVRAYWIMVQKGAPGETYNICSGSCFSIKDILDMLLAEALVSIEVETDLARFRPADIPVMYGDNSKLAGLGWMPEIPIRDSLLDVLDYWRSKV